MAIRSQSSWILLTVLAFAGWSSAAELETVYEWKYIDYAWETWLQEVIAKLWGTYKYETIIPVDFEKISGDRVLVTTPRYYKNPASLSIVSDKTGDGGPLLEPYPNWSWHTIGDCDGITSVNRIFLDECNRLWVVDSGKIGNEQICPAQILAFDPETDELLQRVKIPDNLSHNSKDSSSGRLEVQFVETKGESCDQTWVYIGDPEGYGLVIWDGEDVWRLENDDVYAPESTATTYSVAGENVTLEIGTSIAIIPPPGFIDEDYLLIRPMSSYSDYAMKVEDLHNSKAGGNLTYYKGNITLPSQELVRVISKSGVLMGALASDLVVACYYLGNPLATEYVGEPLEDDEALQFTSAGRIFQGAQTGFEYEEYWLLSNRLQEFVTGTMDFTDINFRILSVNIAELVNGTVCEPADSHSATTIEDKFFFEYETVSDVIEACS